MKLSIRALGDDRARIVRTPSVDSRERLCEARCLVWRPRLLLNAMALAAAVDPRHVAPPNTVH